MGLWSRISDWAKQPFSSNMDATHWFLFVGLMIVIAFAWRNILGFIHEVGEV